MFCWSHLHMAAACSLDLLGQAAECYCDNVIEVTKEDDSDCNMACNGDDSEDCGASNRLTVYQYNGTTALGPVENPGPDGWTSLGCYTDSTAARTLTHQVSTDGGAADMTIALCTSACGSAGYKYAGAEYAGECCKC